LKWDRRWPSGGPWSIIDAERRKESRGDVKTRGREKGEDMSISTETSFGGEGKELATTL